MEYMKVSNFEFDVRCFLRRFFLNLVYFPYVPAPVNRLAFINLSVRDNNF
jgi:hypothetical protein